MRYPLAIVVICCVIVNCSDKKPLPSSPELFADQTISLKLHQAVAIPGTANSIRFDALIYDGRFPHDSTDPSWYFNTAQLQFTVLPAGTKVQLYISGELHDSSGVHFNASPAILAGFSYRLAGLTPLPVHLLEPLPDTSLLASVEIRDTIQPVPSGDPVFPFAIGYQWIYLDSVFDGDTLTSVTNDTVWISDGFIDRNGSWFDLSHYFVPLGSIATCRADTVCNQQISDGMYDPGEPLYYISTELKPPQGDSSKYMIIEEGDMASYRIVKKLSDSVTVPAGTFGNCLWYDNEAGDMKNAQILAPGVGFIYLENRIRYNVSLPIHVTHSWLIKSGMR